MATYKDLEKMYKDWVSKTSNAVKEVVPPIMTEAHKEAIEIEVYAKYDPTMYIREGIIKNEDNFLFDFDINKNNIVITLYNQTTGNADYPNNQSNMYIDSIIVTGNGYSWKNSGIARANMPRDFYKVTEELLSQPKYMNKIKNELNKKGIIVW